MAKDEQYVIDICDRVLGRRSLRGHRFDFLRGDPGDNRRVGSTLPVDAYYEDLRLVVEYCERQHSEAVPLFDKRQTVSGMPRDQQRRRYDQRRRDVLPTHGIALVELHVHEFEHNSSKRLLRVPADERIVRQRLAQWLNEVRH